MVQDGGGESRLAQYRLNLTKRSQSKVLLVAFVGIPADIVGGMVYVWILGPTSAENSSVKSATIGR